ncbi:MAG: NAD+ synthase [Bacteroidales bacterium]|jgi:NAD+ synthase (glutamine-hydrolysing)|nr:NAD+ synthase [Bacteroidales bacterium]
MKIALAQLNFHIGNFAENTNKIIDYIHQGILEKADLVVFPELAVCGYPPRDFLEFDDFISRCDEALQEIASHCQGIAAIVGSPSFNPDLKGKDLFNSAVFMTDGKIQSLRHKTLLPNYDIFDEYRYFEPNKEFNIIEYKGQRIALTICEDLWDIQDDPMYTINPMDELMSFNPDLMINIAASPFHRHQARIRQQIMLDNVTRYNLPLFYVNHVGAQTELIFDGGSMVLSPDGFIAGQLSFFKEDFQIFELENVINCKESLSVQLRNPDEAVYEALVSGIRNYFEKLGFGKAILGLSGGIDSAIVMVLAAEAIGPENVLGVLMPSQFSSDHSVNDALKLAEIIGCPAKVIPIEEAYHSFDSLLKPHFENLPFSIAEENIQARIRAVILMGLSNKFGHILLNTSNKSEAAVGYGTLYGDMCGGLSVIGDLYKVEVYELARFINRNMEIIPDNIITKPPSAELRPDQKDSDSLPDYEILDKVLFQYIENRKGPRELAEMGFEKTMVDRILKLVNTSEYKRYQTPPILRVSSKAFGMGRRMPIVAKYLS